MLPHSPYSPDLAPSDFFLFVPLKDTLRGFKFNNNEEVKEKSKTGFDIKVKNSLLRE